MQNYKTTKKMLRGHSRGDNQIWIYLALTQKQYLFNVKFLGKGSATQSMNLSCIENHNCPDLSVSAKRTRFLYPI